MEQINYVDWQDRGVKTQCHDDSSALYTEVGIKNVSNLFFGFNTDKDMTLQKTSKRRCSDRTLRSYSIFGFKLVNQNAVHKSKRNNTSPNSYSK